MKYLKKYKVILFMIILMLTFLITGCSEYSNEGKNVKEESENITYDNKDTYKKKLLSNLEVDAKVSIPKKESIDVLKVGLKEFNEEEVVKFFIKDEKFDVKKFEDNVSVYKTKAEDNLTLSSGSFNYSTKVGDILLNLYRFIDKEEWKVENFKFKKREEAIKEVEKYLKELGISYDPQKEVYALDYKTLQSYQDKLSKEDDFFISMVEGGKIKLKNWSEEDEAYYIFLKSNIDGVPVTSKSYTLQSADVHVLGAGIRTIISKNGIEEMASEGRIYDKKEIKEKNPKRLSLDEALEKLKVKYESIILGSNLKVKDISLEYVPVAIKDNNSEFYLYPTWCFDIEETGIDEKINKEFKDTITVFINAVTGEEIY
ncbi:hypothetical protein [Clostridium sp.]|uniref:hypothetical protein n=1 Tax=Clostridium sp. TaxID=1506 RepID=UPI00346414DC